VACLFGAVNLQCCDWRVSEDSRSGPGRRWDGDRGWGEKPKAAELLAMDERHG
jgi:hypothetical protein